MESARVGGNGEIEEDGMSRHDDVESGQPLERELSSREDGYQADIFHSSRRNMAMDIFCLY